MPRIKFMASEGGPRPLAPVGDYIVKIVEAKLGTSRTNNPKVTFKFKGLSDADGNTSFTHVAPDGTVNEVTLVDYDFPAPFGEDFSCVPAAGWRLRGLLECADVPHEATPGEKKGEFNIDFDTDDAIGHIVGIHVEHEPYENKAGRKGIGLSIKTADDRGLPFFAVKK